MLESANRGDVGREVKEGSKTAQELLGTAAGGKADGAVIDELDGRSQCDRESRTTSGAKFPPFTIVLSAAGAVHASPP